MVSSADSTPDRSATGGRRSPAARWHGRARSPPTLRSRIATAEPPAGSGVSDDCPTCWTTPQRAEGGFPRHRGADPNPVQGCRMPRPGSLATLRPLCGWRRRWRPVPRGSPAARQGPNRRRPATRCPQPGAELPYLRATARRFLGGRASLRRPQTAQRASACGPPGPRSHPGCPTPDRRAPGAPRSVPGRHRRH